jgi:UDP-glucose 4-epimerase
MTRRSTEAPVTLVTGGAGFIGSHVVDALLARGEEVRVLDDLSSGSVDNLPLHEPRLDLRVGDVGDPLVVASAMRGVRSCIHLAAQPAPARPDVDPYDLTLANLLGLINVLEAARQQDVHRVVFASSAEVYGDAPARPFTEATRPQPTGPRGMEKLLAEGYAALYARQYSLRALGLRYFNVYGPRQRRRDGVIPRFLAQLDGRRPALIRGDGRQVRDFIHVEDAARATLAARDSGHCGVLNVASGQATTIRELVQLLGYALDLRPLMHFVPRRLSETLESWADIKRLQGVTGFEPRYSLRTGLAALASDRAARHRLELPPPAHPKVTPLRPLARRALS